MDKIVHIQLREVIGRLLDQNIHFNATEEAIKRLGDLGNAGYSHAERVH